MVNHQGQESGSPPRILCGSGCVPGDPTPTAEHRRGCLPGGFANGEEVDSEDLEVRQDIDNAPNLDIVPVITTATASAEGESSSRREAPEQGTQQPSTPAPALNALRSSRSRRHAHAPRATSSTALAGESRQNTAAAVTEASEFDRDGMTRRRITGYQAGSAIPMNNPDPPQPSNRRRVPQPQIPRRAVQREVANIGDSEHARRETDDLMQSNTLMTFAEQQIPPVFSRRRIPLNPEVDHRQLIRLRHLTLVYWRQRGSLDAARAYGDDQAQVFLENVVVVTYLQLEQIRLELELAHIAILLRDARDR